MSTTMKLDSRGGKRSREESDNHSANKSLDDGKDDITTDHNNENRASHGNESPMLPHHSATTKLTHDAMSFATVNHNNKSIPTRKEQQTSPRGRHCTMLGMIPPARFLQFHFRVLRSLYDDPNHTDYDSTKSTTVTHGNDQGSTLETNTPANHTGKATIPSSLWQTIEAFLRDRLALWQMKQKAVDWHGVTHHARREVDRLLLVSSSLPTSSTISTAGTAAMTPRSLFSQSITSTHHHQQQHRTPRAKPMGSPLSLRMYQHTHRSMLASTGSCIHAAPPVVRCSFGIVAALLRQKSQSIQNSFHQQKEQYQSLLAMVEHHLNDLENQFGACAGVDMEQEPHPDQGFPIGSGIDHQGHAESAKATADTNSKIQTNVSNWSYYDLEQATNESVSLHTKIRLWRFLLDDLKEIV